MRPAALVGAVGRGRLVVWSATGPAVEAYSKHPVVKKADDPEETTDVSEFLDHVGREVVDFAVGRVLSGTATRTTTPRASTR